MDSRRSFAVRPVLIATGLLAALVAAALVIYGLSPSSTQRQPSSGLAMGFLAENHPAPQFSLPLLAGAGAIGPGTSGGRPVVLNFWSSTCTVCQQETPAIEKVASRVGNRVEFVGVDTLDQRAAALRFARRYGVSYPIAFDSSGSVAARYGVPALPMTFFLSRSGRRIVGLNVGRLTVAKLTAILKRLYGT